LYFKTRKSEELGLKMNGNSLVDIVQTLTDSVNPTDYLKKLRKRDEELGSYLGTNCPHVEMLTETRFIP